MKRCARGLHRGIETIGPLSLGCVLAGASLAKVASFPQFAQTMSRLAFVPVRLAPAAATALIVLECATGLLLLARKSVRVAAFVALSLFIAFALVLSAAIFRGAELPCHCFGTFGPDLPLRGQAVLDLICAVLAFSLAHTPRPAEFGVRRPPWHPGGAAGGALLWGILLIAWPQADPAVSGVIGRTPAPFGSGFPESAGRPAVLLLADFDDFSCQLCLDDFLAFCDSLNTQRVRSAVTVRLVARRDSERSVEAQSRMLEGWASGNGYLFPVTLDSVQLFERSGVEKTSALVIDSDGRLVDIAHFPTGTRRRNEILRAVLD